MKKITIILGFSVTLFLIYLIIQKNLSNNFINSFLSNHLPAKVKSLGYIVLNKRNLNNLSNDYNVKFLPDTQLIKLELNKKKVINDKDNLNKFGFYIDIFDDTIFMTSKNGNIYKSSLDIFELNNDLNIENVKTKIDFDEVLDTHIAKNDFFISGYKKKDNNCYLLKIIQSKLDDTLEFSTLIEFDECGIKIRGGRIHDYIHEGANGLLITTADFILDEPRGNSQSDSSIFGKTLFINLENNNYSIFSKGHRNSLGLEVIDKIIISSEHGPKGGDEINLINNNQNYGWPNASYGVSYNNKRTYLKSHELNSYKEPLHVFVPSIGVSELVYLGNSFNKYWDNNILLASLNDRSIYRLKFLNNNFNKLIYSEKIYIGERIRDIKYVKNKNLILLAMEDSGSLGIIKNIN